MSATHPRLRLGLALSCVGFTATISQLLLVRELIAVYYGNELVLGLILASWLAWVAAGAWVAPRLPPFRAGAKEGRQDVAQDFVHERGSRLFAAGLAAAAALLAVEVTLVRANRALLGITPGALVSFGPMALTIVLVLAPLCVLLGWLFTLGVGLTVERGGRAGDAYVAEGAGSAAGGMLFSLVLVVSLDPIQVILGLAGLDVAIAAVVGTPVGLRGSRRPGMRWLGGAWALLLGGLLLVAAWPLGGWLNRATLGWQYSGLRFARDSAYGRIVVTASGEQRAFFENGLLFFESQDDSAEEMAHLPLLVHPAPRRVLLIGGGVRGTLAHILRHQSVEAVEYVELDPLIIAAARQELPADQAAALHDPRVTLVQADGRAYLREMLRDGRAPPSFDAVLLDLPEPSTGQLNRFYTQEFFGQVRSVMAAGGVFALAMPWQENYPGSALQQLAASIYRTLADQFGSVALIPGERLLMIASEEPLELESEVVLGRLAERSLGSRRVVPSYVRYLLTTDRIVQAQGLLQTHEAVRPNRDLTPISYFYDMLAWLTRFGLRLGRLVPPASSTWLLWLAVPLGVAVALLRRRRFAARRRWSVPAVVAIAGLAQMTLEVVVLLAFQVLHGSLYAQVGLLVAAFMVGLVLGGWVANRWRWNINGSSSLPIGARATLAWIQCAIVLFALALPLILSAGPPGWAFPLLAAGAGALTGLVFPVAVACREDTEWQAARVAGMLYAADLAGACAGAALASTLLVPLVGIPQTCLAMALMGLAGLALWV